MLALILLTAMSQSPETKAKAPETKAKAPDSKKATKPAPAATPEEAFRAFMLAIITLDEPTLRAVSLPNDELGVLLKGQAATGAAEEMIRAQMPNQKFRRLKAGDEVKLPAGTRTLIVRPDEVGADRVFLLPEGPPMAKMYPMGVRKVDGGWRVDATPLIYSRKAVARKQAEREKQQKKDAGKEEKAAMPSAKGK